MPRSFLSPRLGVTLAATLFASATLVSTASAGTTAFKQVGGKLYITAANNDTNNISLEFYSTGGGISSLRIKDLGAGVTLAPGVGIGSTASYTPSDISFNTYAPVTSVRIKSGNLNDTVNTSLTPLPTQVFGGTGDDTVTVGAGASTLSGGAGNDTLNGGSQDDTLIGGTGDDLLFGNAGDDVFFTVDPSGSDESEGGAGDDYVVLDGLDTVGGVESITIGD